MMKRWQPSTAWKIKSYSHEGDNACLSGALSLLRQRERWLAGPTGRVWKSTDIPPTKKRLIPEMDESQQMRLGAWQQFSPGPASVNLQPITAGIKVTDRSDAQLRYSQTKLEQLKKLEQVEVAV